MKIAKEEKKRHIELWKESGLNKTEYAQQIGINRNIFYSWFNQQQNKKRAADQGFVSVSLSAAQCAHTSSSKEAASIKIQLPNNYRIEVYPDFSPDTLRAVVSALEHL